jgi:hypothetical protein
VRAATGKFRRGGDVIAVDGLQLNGAALIPKKRLRPPEGSEEHTAAEQGEDLLNEEITPTLASSSSHSRDATPGTPQNQHILSSIMAMTPDPYMPWIFVLLGIKCRP